MRAVTPYPKDPPFRSQLLRDLARDCDVCQCCGTFGPGKQSGAHVGGLEQGKGMGQKPDDLLAYICQKCHDIIDDRSKSDMSDAEKELMMYKAFHNTQRWLYKNKHLEVKR